MCVQSIVVFDEVLLVSANKNIVCDFMYMCSVEVKCRYTMVTN